MSILKRNFSLKSKLKEFEEGQNYNFLRNELRRWKEFSSQIQNVTEKELREKDALVYKLYYDKLFLKEEVDLKRKK